MLDQNTDRMWYVIGAVIVGAALIFLMNSAFPTLFANIGDTFEDKVGETTEMTDGIKPVKRDDNLLSLSHMRSRYSVTLADFSEYDRLHKVSIEVDNRVSSGFGYNGGIQIVPDNMKLQPDTTYVLEYRYQKIEGKLVTFGGHSDDSTKLFSNNTVYLDGKLRDVNYHDVRSVYVGDDTLVHHVQVYFTTPSSIAVTTGDDRGIWIQPNRGTGVQGYAKIELSDLTLKEVK